MTLNCILVQFQNLDINKDFFTQKVGTVNIDLHLQRVRIHSF